jgi:hypothetical protein
MKTLKLNFSIPEDIAEALKTRVSKRKRSAFVAAVAEKLKYLEQEHLRWLYLMLPMSGLNHNVAYSARK